MHKIIVSFDEQAEGIPVASLRLIDQLFVQVISPDLLQLLLRRSAWPDPLGDAQIIFYGPGAFFVTAMIGPIGWVLS
jgi:hypothetical protein